MTDEQVDRINQRTDELIDMGLWLCLIVAFSCGLLLVGVHAYRWWVS